jgi:hypothetical protein
VGAGNAGQPDRLEHRQPLYLRCLEPRAAGCRAW